MFPRWPIIAQDVLTWRLDRPKMGQNGPKMAQDGSNMEVQLYFGGLHSLRVPGPMALGPWARVQRANRPKGPIGPWPRANRPKGPPGIPRGDPLGSQATPSWIPRDPLKLQFFKNHFFKKISVMLHQWVFYRTYPYDNTIFDNDFSRFFL